MMYVFVRVFTLTNTASVDFGNPQGSLKGIIAAAYPLGAILSLPLIPIINDRFGRRWSIFIGSLIMVIASLVQGFSNSGIHGRSEQAHQRIN
jgi:MFS family permease